MPAPAVIPAPIVYFKVVAVKTLVVNLRVPNKFSLVHQGSFPSNIMMGRILFPKGKRCIDPGSKSWVSLLRAHGDGE